MTSFSLSPSLAISTLLSLPPCSGQLVLLLVETASDS